MPQMVQPAPIEMASPSEPVTPTIATTPQQIEQTEPEVWTNNTSDTQITQTTEVDEPTWTTEQVWEWGRTQGWSDEQIAAYEMVYDQSVRNPDTQSNEEIAASENTQEQDEKTEVIVHDEPTPTHETVVEEVVDPMPQESQASKPDVRKEGIMKAMSGTTQGEAGWYLDGEGNPSRWGIDGDGTWHQTG
jgi:Fe2+ transport system protein B